MGDSAVGKSSLLLRLSDEKFSENYISTIGVDFRFKTLQVDEHCVKLQIWDTAGQERFKTITSAYYRGADGAIVVFDKTSEDSFGHVEYWLSEVRKFSSNTANLVIGNKSDKADEEVVNEERALEFANSNALSYVRTSALNAENVIFAFESISRELIAKKGEKERTRGKQLKTPPKKKGKCC